MAQPPRATDAAPDGAQFDFGASSAQSVAHRPADERTAPAWDALQRMIGWDEAPVTSLLESVAGGDTLLDGWAERVQPLDAPSVPRELLEHAPSFDDGAGLPRHPRHLGRFKMLCAALVTAAHMIFMTGQYLAGAKLFAAPVDLAPVPDAVCRSGA